MNVLCRLLACSEIKSHSTQGSKCNATICCTQIMETNNNRDCFLTQWMEFTNVGINCFLWNCQQQQKKTITITTKKLTKKIIEATNKVKFEYQLMILSIFFRLSFRFFVGNLFIRKSELMKIKSDDVFVHHHWLNAKENRIQWYVVSVYRASRMTDTPHT